MGDGTNIQPWQPETNKKRLAMLGKLIEECNELSARAARCIIQGIDETDPETGNINAAELSREMADVEACVLMIYLELGINSSRDRVAAKLDGFRRWHKMITNPLGIDEAWTELCETPDITSPEEYPDHALITMEQLADFMVRAK